MKRSSPKSKGFDFVKYGAPVSLIILSLLVVFNLIKNFSRCSFRSRLDNAQIFTVSRNELTPNTALLLHMYEDVAEGFFNYLDYTRRDVTVDRHNNALNSELLAKSSDLSLPAFLDLKIRSADQAMFYVADKDIDKNFYLLSVPARHPLRFTMGDIFNLQLFQGYAARQFYYALPKELKGMRNPTGVRILAANFGQYRTIFLNNWKVSSDGAFIRPKYIGLVSNIAVLKPTDLRAQEVDVNFTLALNPAGSSACAIKNVDLAFYLNNVVIKNVALQSGETLDVALRIPISMLTGAVNLLAIVPFYNSVNCFRPSPLYPSAQGVLAEGDYPYLIKSIYITER